MAHETRTRQIPAPTAPFPALTCYLFRFLRGPLLVVLANNDVYLVAMRILIRIIGVVQGHAEAAFRTGLALPGQVQRHGAHPLLVEGGNAALAGQVSGDAGYFHGLGMGGKE